MFVVCSTLPHLHGPALSLDPAWVSLLQLAFDPRTPSFGHPPPLPPPPAQVGWCKTFNSSVDELKYSPCGRFLAAGSHDQVGLKGRFSGQRIGRGGDGKNEGRSSYDQVGMHW